MTLTIVCSFDKVNKTKIMKPKKIQKIELKVCNIASRVFRLRKIRGWSQETLATKAGIARKTLSRLESGNDGIKYETINSVLKALGIEICEKCIGCSGINYDKQANKKQQNNKFN